MLNTSELFDALRLVLRTQPRSGLWQRLNLALLHLGVEPGPGVGPPTLRRGLGNAEHLPGLRQGQSDEITQLHQLGLLWVAPGEPFERVVEGQELIVLGAGGQLRFGKIAPFLAAPMTRRPFATGALDENAAHGFRGGTEEVRAI